MNKMIKTGTAVATIWMMASAATAQTTWVMASGYPEDSFFTQTIRQFIEQVETESEGALTIDLRPNGELIKLDATRRAVQSGQIQLGEIRFGVYGNENPMFTLDSLPNVAGDYDSARLLMEAQKPWFDQEFEANGMTILSYLPWPGQGFYTNFEAGDGADFAGVNLRIYSPATQRMGDLLGFQATILPFAEIPQAFSTGLIQSLFTSAQTGNDIQAWDYVSHFTYTGSMHNKNAIIVSQRDLARLDPDLQEIVIAAGNKATETAWELSQMAGKETTRRLEENGMIVSEASPELQAKLAEIGVQMMEEWSSEAGPEELAVLEAYQAMLE